MTPAELRKLDWIEEQEFDDLCHNYRTWPASDIKGTIERFKELKAFVRRKIEESL